uniref:Methyltransferase type 11 domain-containing protein n=1 Tax=Photinus pyralis TaxID=7054 RepID=A0A1Y1MCS9_PHOPY
MAYKLVVECPSADLKEATFFKKMSSVWWDSKGPYHGQHLYDSAVVPYMVEEITSSGMLNKKYDGSSKPFTGLKILEVGCGGGIVCEMLSKYGGDITGLDINRCVLDVAKEHLNRADPKITNINYILQSAEDHCLSNAEKYDVVILNTVIQHVVEKNTLLKSCVRCLKPGGSILISGFSQTWMAWFVLIILSEWLGCTPVGTSDWSKLITLGGLKNMMKRYKCKLVASKGISHNVFADTWTISKCQSMCYAARFVKQE